MHKMAADIDSKAYFVQSIVTSMSVFKIKM